MTQHIRLDNQRGIFSTDPKVTPNQNELTNLVNATLPIYLQRGYFQIP